ncbi:MAG: Lrp/AsnC family transcriptional regulator [Halocynthiibacter sp.]
MIDEIDSRILDALSTNSRLAVTSLAKDVGLSAPSVTERIRRLEEKGILNGFTIDINHAALGFTMDAIVRIRPRPGSLHIVEKMIQDEPRFTACDKVTGEDCFVTRLALRSIEELDPLLDPFHDRAETNTAIVKSSPVAPRRPK